VDVQTAVRRPPGCPAPPYQGASGLNARGVAIPNTHVSVTIGGVAFQGWSRHRKAPHTWDPNSDNVGTHFSLVEHSLAREFGE
jgi:hypothetical protein